MQPGAKQGYIYIMSWGVLFYLYNDAVHLLFNNLFINDSGNTFH